MRIVLRRLAWWVGLSVGLSAGLWLGAALPSSLAAAEPYAAGSAAASQQAFAAQIRPLLAKYCIGCHSGAKPKGHLNLDAYRDLAELIRDRQAWQGVVDNVRNRVMPPEGKPQPSAAEREQLVRFVDGELARADQGRRGPGRVTMRRLNRAEYNNTIRDLLGIDFHPADDFPSDDVGYGFDNIGDVLSLPPILLEKYLAAAEKISVKAIIAPETVLPSVTRIDARHLENTMGGDQGGRLNTNGEVFARLEFPHDGEYALKVSAWGEQAGDELPQLVIGFDGKELRAFDIKATEGSAQECRATVRATAGKHKVAATFINDFYEPKTKRQPERDRNVQIEWLEIESSGSPELLPLPASHRRVVNCRPHSREERQVCARQVVEQLSIRAFRRPIEKEEVDRLARLVTLAMDQGDSFERGVQLAVQAMLVSPHFLFRVEADRPPEGSEGAYTLNDYELASRLSYFLWSSMPDDALFALAGQGKLRQPGVLVEQARRMIQDPKSQALVENFSSQWLQTRKLGVVSPATEAFKDYDEQLASAMRIETEMFFAAILREDRSLLEFLDANFTFVNERLAKHYGIEGIKGDKFRRVELANPDRGGVLTQASMLTLTSNPTRTSPVKRGKWILENILGTPPPPPPPDVPELNEGRRSAGGGSLRQRLEQHRANPACASCHARMDPLGFGLENFDGIGAWRERDGNFAINASGTLPDGQKFNGPRELKAYLKTQHIEFTRCLVEKLLTYALGRGLELTDRSTVGSIVEACARQNYKLSALVEQIIVSEPFLKRSPAPRQP